MKSTRRETPQGKTKAVMAARKKLPKRRCLGNTPMRGDCNREFKPKNKFNYICEVCSNYFKENNVSGD